VKREWIEEAFPEQVTAKVEHLYDRTHKRVAAVKLVRFRDLVIHHEHQREADPKASGQCLAEAYRKGYYELPLFNHELKQLISRVNLVVAVMPELEFPPFNEAAITACLARAFEGLTLAKEAQATPLRDAFVHALAKEQLGWLDELAPTSIPWADGRKVKLLYPEQAHDEDGQPNSPELQVKLHECFTLKAHPLICEGRLPVKLWLEAGSYYQLDCIQGEQLPEAQTRAPKEAPRRALALTGVGVALLELCWSFRVALGWLWGAYRLAINTL
jgi:hypothetical protein